MEIIASTMGENIEGLNALKAAEKCVVGNQRLLEMITFPIGSEITGNSQKRHTQIG